MKPKSVVPAYYFVIPAQAGIHSSQDSNGPRLGGRGDDICDDIGVLG